jgi:hypothetical protein
MNGGREMKTLIVSMVLAVGAGSVSAHEGMHGPGGQFDADESGNLSIAEYTAYLKATKQDVSQAAGKFAALDTNKDGALSSAEFARGEQPKKK